MYILRAWANFTNDIVAVEKLLRFFQASLIVAGSLSYRTYQSYQPAWVIPAKSQTAFVRKFFRLFKWIDCWDAAYRQLLTMTWSTATFRNTVVIAQLVALGMYFFFDMFTIVAGFGISKEPWVFDLEQFALKCWFHSLSLAIVLALDELISPSGSAIPQSESSQDGKSKPVAEKAAEEKDAGGDQEKTARSRQKARRAKNGAYKNLVMNSCDVIIPASGVGWVKIDPAVVGTAMAISTILACQDIWRRVQREKMTAS